MSDPPATSAHHLLASIAGEPLPRPTPGFRQRAWRDFQRALDPLASPRPLKSVRSSAPDGGAFSLTKPR